MSGTLLRTSHKAEKDKSAGWGKKCEKTTVRLGGGGGISNPLGVRIVAQPSGRPKDKQELRGRRECRADQETRMALGGTVEPFNHVCWGAFNTLTQC